MCRVGRSHWPQLELAADLLAAHDSGHHVLKPDFTATFSRGILRTAGTIGGLVFATLLVQLLPSGVGAEIILVALLTFALRWAGPANYGILTAAVSALVVMLIAVSGIAPKDVIVARGVNTLAGGALALAAYILWPTWQQRQIREVVATMLDAYRDYFRRVSQVYLQPAMRDEDELNASRSAARLTRSNVEASIDRMTVEPGVTHEIMSAWNAMLASSHGLINAVMALEAALPDAEEAPMPDGFRAYCHDVEILACIRYSEALNVWGRRSGAELAGLARRTPSDDGRAEASRVGRLALVSRWRRTV